MRRDEEQRLRRLVREIIAEEVPNCVPDEDLPGDYEAMDGDPCEDGWSMLGLKPG